MTGQLTAERFMKRKFDASLVLLFVCLTSPQIAWAYLDPGTGSMMIQAIIAGVTGAAVIMRLYWAKVTAFFGREPSEPDVSVGVNSDANDELS